MEIIEPIFLADKVSSAYIKPEIQLINPIKASTANKSGKTYAGYESLHKEKIRRQLSITLAALMKGGANVDYFRSS